MSAATVVAVLYAVALVVEAGRRTWIALDRWRAAKADLLVRQRAELDAVQRKAAELAAVDEARRIAGPYRGGG